jgi:hypothetical protein
VLKARYKKIAKKKLDPQKGLNAGTYAKQHWFVVYTNVGKLLI